MGKLTKAPWILVATLFSLLVLPTVAVAVGQPAWISLVARMLIYALGAISLDLILGYGGLACFGHAAFYGIGGYTVAILYRHWQSADPLWGFVSGSGHFLVTVPMAMLLGALVAVAIGALSLRTLGVQFLMITLAFAQMLFYLFSSLSQYGGNDGMTVRQRNEFPGLDLREDSTFYYLIVVIFSMFIWVCWRLVRSRFGIVLGGIRQNERRMVAIGINTYRYKLVAFTIAGSGAALAGALMVNHTRFVSPDMMHWTKSGEFMIMVILGGAGTLFGPVFGAISLVGLEDMLGQVPRWGEHKMLVIGAILVLVVLFGRGGIYGWIRSLITKGDRG